jgi:Peptidase family M28
LNLEGAGAGGYVFQASYLQLLILFLIRLDPLFRRPVLFRTSSNTVTQAFTNVPHPHGSVVSSDVFARGLIQSGTDFSVYQTNGMRGLDLAFYKRRSLYHTKRDSVPSLGGINSLWTMMESALISGIALTETTPVEDVDDPAVYYDRMQTINSSLFLVSSNISFASFREDIDCIPPPHPLRCAHRISCCRSIAHGNWRLLCLFTKNFSLVSEAMGPASYSIHIRNRLALWFGCTIHMYKSICKVSLPYTEAYINSDCRLYTLQDTPSSSHLFLCLSCLSTFRLHLSYGIRNLNKSRLSSWRITYYGTFF